MSRRSPHVIAMQTHPNYKPTKLWDRANLYCYAEYRDWLKQTGCGKTMLGRYTASARWVFCLIDKPYWQIDIEADIAQVHTYLTEHVHTVYTPLYVIGLTRFREFLRLKCHLPPPERVVRWDAFLCQLPAQMAADVRAFLTQRQTQWSLANRHDRTLDMLSTLARPLRHMHQMEPLTTWRDLTPKRWWRYIEMRQGNGIATCTLNAELHLLRACMHFVQDNDGDVNDRFMRLEGFKPTVRVPRDAPLDAIRSLLRAVDAQCRRTPINNARLGRLDHVWLLLMLHCGMRTAEVRNLRMDEIDWPRRFIRIEQSKGLKDRLVPMSDALIATIRAYLQVRGPADMLPPNLLVFQHKPLSRSFVRCRLRCYEQITKAHITPHQLRHTCATLLLNAGMPVTTVKVILGHMQINTTLGYARVYDGTLAADYHRAMLSVDSTLNLGGSTAISAPTPAHIAALLDALKTSGTLNAEQLNVLATARAGVLALTGA